VVCRVILSNLIIYHSPEEGDADDSDDDLQVGGVTQEYKDPISLKELRDPWTS
jgi:hypothetical protein